MSFLETMTTVIGVAVVTAMILGLLLLAALRRQAGGSGSAEYLQALSAETECLRAANLDLARKLAVAEIQAARVSQAETALAQAVAKADELRDAKAAVNIHLSSANEALAKTKEQATELRDRLMTSENAYRDVQDELRAILGAKAATDQTLSAREEALSRSEATLAEARERLSAAEKAHDQLKDEKAAGDEVLAARTEALKRSEANEADLRAALTQRTTELSEAHGKESDLRARLATVEETLGQERKQAQEKLAILASAKEEMTKEFKILADEVMLRHGESFSKLNKEQIDGVLTPLKEKLREFERSIQTSHTESTRERATLAEQIRQITETGAAMGRETKELTEALRGKSQTQGAWGEMVLGSVLERSGLRADEEYSVQKSFCSEEGQRFRPDVVINLPGGQSVIVDAKVSLTAFEALVNAGTDEERDAHRARHLASVRDHISRLGSKAYHLATGTKLDYVVMFVPIEGALAAALQADASLISFAVERNVAIATPTTLMIALRTVANVWQVERRNRNADEIAARAGKLYDKFVGFVTDLTAVGDSIEKTRRSFDGAMGKLNGRGSIVRQVEQLRAMGARASKSLPASLLEAADTEPGAALTPEVSDLKPHTEFNAVVLEVEAESN